MNILVPYIDADRSVGAWPSTQKLDALGQADIEFTSDCNLRCVYCPVSSKTYHGVTMPDNLIKMLETQLSGAPIKHVGINGHGETTMVQDWMDKCRPFLMMTEGSHLISNFARLFTKDELEVLARVEIIIVSLDTVDQELLKDIRRKVDLRNILTNIIAVRATAHRLGVREPKIQINAGIYDRNIFGLPDLAHFCVALKLHCLSFWSLVVHSIFVDDVKCDTVEALSAQDLKRGVEAIDETIAILRKGGVACSIPGDFVSSIRRIARQKLAAEAEVANA